MQNVIANLLKVCSNVSTEPPLQPLADEHLSYRSASGEDGARLDVAADGFWGIAGQRSVFQCLVFKPMAPAQQSLPLNACYIKMSRRRSDCMTNELERYSLACSPL